MHNRSSKIIVFVFILLFLTAQTAYALPDNDGEQAAIGEQVTADNLPNNFSNAPNINSPSAILIESQRGQVLYQKNATEKLHISVANKIMTALIALEKVEDLNSKVTISKESVALEGSALSLEVGEKYALEDLLLATILTTANDAARAIAEFVGGGDLDNFVSLMNDKSHELNMKDTFFTNPTGLYDENQYTTAYDTALLIKYALRNPSFNRIFSYWSKPWVDPNGETKILASQNRLFWSYEGVDGGKIGFNDKEQQSIITTATRNNQRLICIVLNGPEQMVYDDSIALLDFGFENFRTGILVPKGYPQKSIQIADREVNMISLNDIYYTYPIGENYIKSVEFAEAEDLNPPITKNRVIGTVRYVLKDNSIIDVNLYPDIEILLPESTYATLIKKITENKDLFYLLIFLIVVEAVLIVYKLIKLIIKVFTKKRQAVRKYRA
jgi:D-alanyl-D-alanine carboxypeptidase (penicillin-binding protein 5/6)